MTPPPLNDSPRFLIVRLSAVGDLVQVMLPAGVIREPGAGALIGQRAATPLRKREALDELGMLPRSRLKSPKTVWQLRARLRARKLEIALLVQDPTRTAILAWLSGASRRIGFGGHCSREDSRDGGSCGWAVGANVTNDASLSRSRQEAGPAAAPSMDG
jgi:ADP-heptose:LPS heptosyltransferase